jgi:hypothetical protein
MNPFRFFLRITEYLAGPPVYEEINTLQEQAESLRRQVAELRIERDRIMRDVARVAMERDGLTQRVGKLEAERDELLQRRNSLEKQLTEIRKEPIQVQTPREELPLHHNMANLSDGLPERSTHSRNIRDHLLIKPGTFALLNEVGDDSGYRSSLTDDLQTNGVHHSFFAFAQKAVYDPIADQVLFSGAPNGSSPNALVRYDVATNKWTAVPVSGAWPTGCAYDTNAINPTRREMYVSSMLRSHTLRRMNLDTGKWSSMAQPDSIGFTSPEASAEYFTERDELLWLQNKRLGVWNPASNKWTATPAALTGLGWRSAIARYNPVSHCVLIIGGADLTVNPTDFSHAVYRYDKNGVTVRLKDSPPSIKIYINRALVTVDPVSGDFLFLQAVLGSSIDDFTGRIEFWKYSIDNDVWTQLDESAIPAPAGWWADQHLFGVVAAPISRYGLIMFMSGAGPNSKVYLYKHAADSKRVPIPDKEIPCAFSR